LGNYRSSLVAKTTLSRRLLENSVFGVYVCKGEAQWWERRAVTHVPYRAVPIILFFLRHFAGEEDNSTFK